MFKPVYGKVKFPQVEEEILKFWENENIFQKSLSQTQPKQEFVFYDGPPFATGLPHYGHLLAGTIKDIIPRYQTMKGYYVQRRFGWDCHGLPVEYEVEQELQISGKTEIERIGVNVFNERCRSIVLKHTREWREIVTRMGRWVDFDNDYKTMDPKYMESIWWVFKTLWDKRLIYEGNKVLPYCPRCTTPLSNFETNLGYVDVDDPSITIRFKVHELPNTYILAWTTTPWTLPSNMALAIGQTVRYVRIHDHGIIYIMARDRLPVYYPEGGYDSIEDIDVHQLVGLTYEPLFPYFEQKRKEGAFRIVTADFVSTEEGTGVVHIAPGFGEEDYQLGLSAGIPMVCPVDAEGRFTEQVADYVGRYVKDTDADIIARLKQEGKLVHRGTIRHNYPHCWRCDTPLIYRAISTWFVAVEKIKDRIISANKQVHWVPEHLRDGRFGKWLEGARDWAISRNRYWGTPLPIWTNEDHSEIICVGSIIELERLSGKKLNDIHKHIVDKVEIPSSSGGSPLRRVSEVLDCWFESGAMPYAQAHYPFENREHFEKHFPADFIAEGLDQTRGWFYTLMVLSTALFDKPAFRNVIVNGLVLAEDGRKMSKRLKNYPDPMDVINTHGADAVRLYMINSPVVKAEDLRFSEHGVAGVVKDILIPLWNAYSFFVTYANIDGWVPAQWTGKKSPNELDRWILSSMEKLLQDITSAMDKYDLHQAVRPFVVFIDQLTNWYIRRSRRRFWKSQNDEDKNQAYETLYTVLVEVSKIIAPFVPFISESIYRNLRTNDMPESVHLCRFPVCGKIGRELDLEAKMDRVSRIVKLGRSLRVKHGLKIRQPLSAICIVSPDKSTRENIEWGNTLILEELNVKEIRFEHDDSSFASYEAKPDFKVLGPKFATSARRIAKAITELKQQDIRSLANGLSVSIEFDGMKLEIVPEDVIIEKVGVEGVVVATDGDLIIALDTTLNDELIQEGLAREFVHAVQNMRKDKQFDISQRIRIKTFVDDVVASAINKHKQYIMSETLATSCVIENSKMEDAYDAKLNGHSVSISVYPV